MTDYKSLLPEYNPDPVFIFKSDGECYFKNEPATRIFAKLENLNELRSDLNISQLIENSMTKHITHKIEKKYYQLNLVGVKEKNILMVYSQDITNLINSMHKEKEAMQTKDDFFRNISHEMKTPLNAIIGLTPLLKKSMQQDPKLVKIVTIIDENSHTLHRLIEKVLDIQSIHEKTFSLQKSEFNIITSLEKLFTQHKIISTQKEQEFRVQIDEESIPKTLTSDEKQILRVIDSVLDNAIKFTPKGGIVASKITFDATTQILKILIKDNGIGITPENQTKIFQAQQVDASTTRAHEGSGLELFIAVNILTILGGDIHLKSELNKGSVFTISIPTV